MCTPRRTFPRIENVRQPFTGGGIFKRPFFESFGRASKPLSISVNARPNNDATCKGDVYVPPIFGLLYFGVSWYQAPDIVDIQLISSGDDLGLNAVGFYSTNLTIVVDGELATQFLYVNTNPAAPEPYSGHLAFWVTDLYDGTNFFNGWLIYAL